MVFPGTKRKQKSYDALLPQIEALINKQGNLPNNLSTVVNLLHKHLGADWTGFYKIGQGLIPSWPSSGVLQNVITYR